MKTIDKQSIANILRISINILKFEQEYFICDTISVQYENGLISMAQRNLAQQYLNDNKPNESLHKEFFNNPMFTSGGLGWWKTNHHSASFNEDAIDEANLCLEQRLKFLRHLINQLS